MNKIWNLIELTLISLAIFNLIDKINFYKHIFLKLKKFCFIIFFFFFKKKKKKKKNKIKKKKKKKKINYIKKKKKKKKKKVNNNTFKKRYLIISLIFKIKKFLSMNYNKYLFIKKIQKILLYIFNNKLYQLI